MQPHWNPSEWISVFFLFLYPSNIFYRLRLTPFTTYIKRVNWSKLFSVFIFSSFFFYKYFFSISFTIVHCNQHFLLIQLHTKRRYFICRNERLFCAIVCHMWLERKNFSLVILMECELVCEGRSAALVHLIWSGFFGVWFLISLIRFISFFCFLPKLHTKSWSTIYSRPINFGC